MYNVYTTLLESIFAIFDGNFKYYLLGDTIWKSQTPTLILRMRY